MPYPHPTLTQLLTQAGQDITQSSIPGADGLLQKSILNLLGQVQAGFAFGHYGYLDWIAQQCTPFTATDEYLEAWAAFKQVFREPATYASGASAAAFTGTVGTPLSAGTPLTRSDGYGFTISNNGTIASNGTLLASIEATTAGADGNTAIGALISLSNSVAGIANQGTVVALVTGGADQEIDDSLRSRMLAAFASPSMGGDQNDYVNWALEVNGVTRAWCSPNQMGAGTVVVYIMLDVTEAAYGGFPQGSTGGAAAETRTTPASGDQLNVANYIFPLQPVTALVYVAGPNNAAQNFVFSEITPNTSAIQALVTTALQSMFLRLGTALGGTIYESDWTAALDAVPGLTDYVISSPTGTITTSVGQIPTLGTVTW